MAKDRSAAMSALMRCWRAIFAGPDAAQSGGGAHRNSAHTIGALISALNDRNVSAALCLLEPSAAGPGLRGSPDDGGSTRRKCVGCGE